MFIYYNKESFDIFAISEKQIIKPPLSSTFIVEYHGDIPDEINKWLFNGAEFISKPILDLVVMENLLQNSFKIQYLKLTDWYVIRKLEKNINIPQHIQNARNQARDEVLNNEEAIEKYYIENPGQRPLTENDSNMNSHGMKHI